MCVCVCERERENDIGGRRKREEGKKEQKIKMFLEAGHEIKVQKRKKGKTEKRERQGNR